MTEAHATIPAAIVAAGPAAKHKREVTARAPEVMERLYQALLQTQPFTLSDGTTCAMAAMHTAA